METKEIIYANTFVDFPTITAQQKGVTRNGHFYTKPEVAKARMWFINHFLKDKETIKELYPDISDGAFEVGIWYYYPIKNRKLWGKLKTSRPDVDNQAKLILDAITDTHLFWSDDSQVCALHLYKRYEEISKITIIINKIKEDEP